MGTATVLLSFEVDKDRFDSEESHALYASIPDLCFDNIEGIQTVCTCGTNNDKLITASAENGSHVVIRIFHFALMTVDIQYVVDGLDNLKPMAPPYDMIFIKEIEKKIKNHLGDLITDSKSIFSPIKRAPGITWPYGVFGDERLMELDYVKLVHKSTSKWQSIKIYTSKEFGNILVLDDDIMLGESDLIYTQTLLGLPVRNEFKDKSILILGGGDGGILHELLKENPKFVLMAEIDEEVIKACRTHMPSVCGNSLDNFEGHNYKIEIEDCIKILQKAVENGQKFDYVINDLTEFSVDKDQYGFNYNFTTGNVVLELSIKCLATGGKYLARGNCLSCELYVKDFEQNLTQLGCNFERRDVHVPSFRETYCLYEAWRKQE